MYLPTDLETVLDTIAQAMHTKYLRTNFGPDLGASIALNDLYRAKTMQGNRLQSVLLIA